jgi:hypothetical protein
MKNDDLCLFTTIRLVSPGATMQATPVWGDRRTPSHRACALGSPGISPVQKRVHLLYYTTISAHVQNDTNGTRRNVAEQCDHIVSINQPWNITGHNLFCNGVK